MRRLVLAFLLSLTTVGGASAEVVARGVEDGMLALGPKATPFVAYVRGTRLMVSTRASKGSWRATRVGSVSAGAHVMALTVGPSGPLVLVQSADARKLLLVRRLKAGWQTARIAGGLPAGVSLGWPGVAFDRHGQPVVAYTRWSVATQNSELMLAHITPRGRVSTLRITLRGFPKSWVAPPATPLLVRGQVHVIETFGYSGTVGTIEWKPQNHTWIGLFLSAGRGDWPLGPMLAGVSPGGTVYAAWTESLQEAGDVPVILASHGRSTASEIVSDFVFDRALTTGLVTTSSGPEVAANEWVGADDLGLSGDGQVWAGAIVGHRVRVELDGRIGGFAAAPQGARQLLLSGAGGLSWFRSPRRLSTHVTITATPEADGGVRLGGSVVGAIRGRVTLFRERPGTTRQKIGSAALANGSFSFVDRASEATLLYRAVYTDPASGIPYAALLRQPVS